MSLDLATRRSAIIAVPGVEIRSPQFLPGSLVPLRAHSVNSIDVDLEIALERIAHCTYLPDERQRLGVLRMLSLDLDAGEFPLRHPSHDSKVEPRL